MNKFVRTLGISAIGIALVGATACGGGGDEKTFDLVGGDLPDSFPDDFPIYDGADLQGASRAEQDGIEGIVATWTTGDDFDDVTAFYTGEFEGGPWTSSTTGSAAGSTWWSAEHPDGKVAYVTVTQGDDVAIMAVVGDDPDQASSDDDDDTGSDDSSGDDSSSDGTSSDDEGSSDSGGGGADLPDEVDLPDDFPTDLVSFPDSLRITTGTSYSANGQATYMVGFFTDDSADSVADHFEDQLTGKGYTQSVRTSDATGVYTAYAENDDGTGTIIVVSVNDTGAYEGYNEGVVQVTVTE